MFTLCNSSRYCNSTFSVYAYDIDELILLLLCMRPYVSNYTLSRVRSWASCANGTFTFCSYRWNFLIIRENISY